MSATVLILGALGRVGSQVVSELEQNGDGVSIRLATSRADQAESWKAQGRETVILDLNDPQTFGQALVGVDRIFLLTGYTSDVLFQSKTLVDAAVDAGISHIVHLGVFSSGRDLIPHFSWHDLIEAYIEASGVAWTHLHPNVIADTALITDPPISETHSFQTFDCATPQGWVFAADIGAVAAAVLREGPAKHGGANYFLSTELLTGGEVADILTAAAGRTITCNPMDPAEQEAFFAQIPSIATRAYMESAMVTLRLSVAGKMVAQTVIRDDAQTVLGRPGTTMAAWARAYFAR